MRILNLHGFGGSSENTSYRMIRQVSPSSDLEVCIEDYYSDEDYRKEVLFDFCDELVGGWV